MEFVTLDNGEHPAVPSWQIAVVPLVGRHGAVMPWTLFAGVWLRLFVDDDAHVNMRMVACR